jgi:hypothetical protein
MGTMTISPPPFLKPGATVQRLYEALGGRFFADKDHGLHFARTELPDGHFTNLYSKSRSRGNATIVAAANGITASVDFSKGKMHYERYSKPVIFSGKTYQVEVGAGRCDVTEYAKCDQYAIAVYDDKQELLASFTNDWVLRYPKVKAAPSAAEMQRITLAATVLGNLCPRVEEKEVRYFYSSASPYDPTTVLMTGAIHLCSDRAR